MKILKNYKPINYIKCGLIETAFIITHDSVFFKTAMIDISKGTNKARRRIIFWYKRFFY